MTTKTNAYRNGILIASVFAMLFAGIIYAWSILKVPLAEDFGWSASQLTLNYTLTMCGFCIGGLTGGVLLPRIGAKWSGLLASVIAGVGIMLTGLLDGSSVVLLYLTYAVMGGFGIGLSYNVIISTVSAWFPDKKGFCSGCLLMGFGASSLLLGNLADALFKTALGRCGTFVLLGAALLIVVGAVSLFLKAPAADVVLPAPKMKATANFGAEEYTTKEMLKRFTFWRGFLLLTFVTAVGNSVISFARDLAVSVGAGAMLATNLVGILAVCNGLSRILSGALFDACGRKTTMMVANITTIVAAGVTLLSVVTNSLVVCIIGLCFTGFSYGSCPIQVTSFISAFYGQKYFASNFSVMNCNLIFASFIATACSSLSITFGTYAAPFVLLLALSFAALALNLSLKRP